MANKTIDFDEIYAGQKGSEVSQIILENLKKLSARIIELEDKISQIKGSSIDGATVIDNTGSISVQYAPTSVFGKTYPTSQVSYVSVKVTYGTSDLYPGTDDSSLHYSYSITNSDIMSNGKKIGTVEPVVEYSNLKFKVIISPNTISDSNFSFTITFKGKTYSYTVPIIIMNDNHALNGQSVYTSTVFQRSTLGTPSTPTGGSFDNPLPNGWSDGITGGSGDLYTSHRTFTSDGQPPQSADWSIPVLAQDSADIDFCYSAYTVGRPKSPSELGLPHGSQDSDTSIYHWHDSGTENDVWMAVSVKSGNEWGDWSVLKIKGENGINGDWKNTIYKEFDGTSLEEPNIMNPNNFVDLEDSEIRKDDGTENKEERNKKWKDGPSQDGIWWMSVGTIDGTTNLCQYGWSKPVKISPRDGVAGAACFMSTVFKRCSDSISTPPTGGNYSKPLPDDKSWSDGIPADDGSGNPIWESHRRFTSDGKAPQDTEWSTPKLMIDTADFDVCYSAYSGGVPTSPSELDLPHGSQDSDTSIFQWHDSGRKDDIWMATSHKRSQGEWSAWTITKIVGENGRNGDWMDYVFKQYSGDTLSAPTINDPNDFASVKEEDKVNFGWLDGPGVGPDWWMSCALIDGTTGKLKVDGWSEPKKLQGKDGSYNKYQYAANTSMTKHPEEGKWKDSVQDVYTSLGVQVLPSNHFMWMRQQAYDPETKEFGEWEYMRVTGEKGEPGTSIAIKGTVNSYKELFSLSGVTDGDSYMVFGDLWVYNASNEDIKYDELDEVLQDLYNPDGLPNFPGPGHWRNCGHIIGPSGTSQYLHIKYAEMLDCSGTTTDGKVYLYPSVMTGTPSYYIGVLVDHTEEASNDPERYQWARFTGDDGYSYEYLYRLSKTSTPYDVPVPPDTCAEYSSEEYQKNDYVPPVKSGEPWTDNPSGVSSEYPYEFMIKRVKKNNKWEPFTGSASDTLKAILYSYLGKDAPYIQRQWAAFQSLVLTDEQKDVNDIKKYWQDVIPTVESGYYLWERSRTVTPPRGSEEGSHTDWQYERRTGEKGNTGTGLEIQGSMPSYHDLFALSDPEDGTCYIVFGHLWSWVASSTEIIFGNLSLEDKEAYKAKYGTELSQRHWRDGGQIQGPQGVSGETAYLHIKFANTARYISGNTYEVTDKEWLTTFATSHDGEAPGRFIGMYTDSNQTDSSEPSKYIWTKYTGDDGLNYEYIYTRTATDTDVLVPRVTQEMVNGTDTTPVNVVESINQAGVINTTKKAYQENDWVPYTGTTVNEESITDYNWTDNPMGPTEELPFEWCCKREKSISISGSTALWGAFYGKANDTTKAFLFNKYGDSALQIDMTNQIHGYKRNAYGNCIIETVVCKINASKDGNPKTIENIVVSGDTSQFQPITANTSTGTVTLINKSNMTSGDILTFKITIDKVTYDKTFNYTVTDDGTPGLTIYFDPESIVAEEDIVSGVVSTENTYAHLNVYQDGKQLKYKSGGTLASDEYSVSITDESANIRQKIDFTASNDNGRYKFHITNFDVRGTKPYGGTVEFNIVTGGITYKRALKWMVNWLGFFRQTICGDTMTNIAQSVNSAIDDMGLLTTTSANSMFVQSSTGIVGQVSQLSGDVKSLSGTTGSLQLSADSFSTKIEATDKRFSKIEQTVDNLSLKVGERAVRQNLLPNSRFNLRTNYYWFSTRKIILSPGQYTLSGRGRVDGSGCNLRLIAYLNDDNWNNSIYFNSNSFVIKETTFNVTNENTICDLGVYFSDNGIQYSAPLGKLGYIDWVKIENGSGATEYCQSIYDTGVNNILNLTPYEVSDFNTDSISKGTKTKYTSNDGNYVTISNSSGIDWQLRWFNEKHYNESLVLNGGPRTTYYWMVVRRKSSGSNDKILFGVQNRSTGYGTSHFNTSSIINSQTSKYFTLNNGWVMYYASANLMNSAFKQKNILEISASYKVTITTPQPTQTQTKLVFEEGTFTYTFPSGSTAEDVAKIIEKNGADGYNTTRNGNIVYFINKTKMKHSSASADGASTKIEKYKGNWVYDYSSGVKASGGVLTYSTNNAPTDKNIVLGEYIIDDNLTPGQIYTLSFVAKNTWSSSGVPLSTYVYFLGTDFNNPLGSLSNQFKPYVETSESGVNGATSISYVENTADCTYSWKLTSDFKEYSYSFKVSSTYDRTKDVRVLFRLNHVNGGSYDVTIKQIKLEQGGGKTGYNSRPGYFNTAPQQYIGINSVVGTWDVLDCGISNDGVPSVASISSTLLAAKQRGELLDTGIDIENRHVTITSDNFTVQNNEGNQTFLIDEFGKVNANVLNADAILTNALSAKTINANSATFTNIKIAGESSFGGLVKKIKTILTKDNLLNYAKEDFTEGSKLKIWSLEKLGTWIEIQSVPDNYILLFELPSISAYDVNGNPYDIDKLNYARSMVGNTLIITNKTLRQLNVRGYISIGIGQPGNTVNYIDSGCTMSLTCKMRPFPEKTGTYSYLYGFEEVYWEGVTMKTSPEKETT